MIEGIFGLPTTVGNFILGASSPDRPAFMFPEPLSITTEVLSAIKLQIINTESDPYNIISNHYHFSLFTYNLFNLDLFWNSPESFFIL